jgi:hypothetical protein
MRKTLNKQIFPVLIGVLFFLGGTGIKTGSVLVLGTVLGLVFLLYAFYQKRKIILPKGFLIYLLVYFLMIVNLLWSKYPRKGVDYLWLFGSGGLFWLSIYNLRGKFENLDLFIVVLGILFGALFVFYQLNGKVPIHQKSLYLQYTETHNHLGNLWALVLVILVHKFVKKRNFFSLALFVLGGYFLLVSLSRSAYVALAVGVAYLFIKQDWMKRFRKIFWVVVGASVLLFLYASIFKSIFYSRAYFVQAILGFIHNPLGVGMGNFGIISRNSTNHFLGLDSFSSLAHNVFLEFLVGMGILGFSFIWWFLKVVKGFLRTSAKKTILYQALFLALAANFFFDTTYVIPTMIWLWFMVLGLAQADVKITK